MEEFLEVLDENGNKTGEIKTREEIHRAGDWHRAIHVWIINPQHELLIQRRAASKESYPDKWDQSLAGHVRQGEEPAQAVVRELQEELGLEVKPEDLDYLFLLTTKEILNGGQFINNEFNEVYLVHADFAINWLTLQPEEVSAARWVNYHELEKTLESQAQDFVPHPEEYRRLFEFLRKLYD